MDKTKLTAYLKCLYELEASLYYQKRVYNVVSNEQQNVLASYRGESEIPHKNRSRKNRMQCLLQLLLA